MKILDIHTHHKKRGAIVNTSPNHFAPIDGYYYSVGIHPWHISLNYQDELEKLRSIVLHPQVLAIGETGLDKLKGAHLDLQLLLFKSHVEMAGELNKPLIIHSVRSSNELIKLKKELKPDIPWIIHGFRGNENIMTELVDAGFYLSYGEKYNIDSLKNTPIDRLLIETDESLMDVHEIYESVSFARNLPLDMLYEQIDHNIRTVFF